MVFEIKDVYLSYKYGCEPNIPINLMPIDLFMTYKRVGFPREYFPILKHEDDVDRMVTMIIEIRNPLVLEMSKIAFVSFLKIFYQNIKHKDGKADIFEIPLPYPSLKHFIIKI
eukprot:GHVR01052845.1.p1 GENE.GHVR01052845.1~~GHVR01052845.1.p1  ORF type:complete len:113 (+),score=1.51 GHVR01052845.1:475-813(+)